MKKIVGIVCLALCITLNANAQVSSAFVMTGNGDTIANTGTKTNTLKIADSYSTVSIQSVITKVSGTVAGTITLQGSNDGTNYVIADTSIVTLGEVTFSPTNVATQSSFFIINGSPYLWYRVSYTGAGTMAAIMRSYVVPKK